MTKVAIFETDHAFAVELRNELGRFWLYRAGVHRWHEWVDVRQVVAAGSDPRVCGAAAGQRILDL